MCATNKTGDDSSIAFTTSGSPLNVVVKASTRPIDGFEDLTNHGILAHIEEKLEHI
ncbi:MAG: hypothetical protein IBX40_05500 [Methanosarcinales archaeon]|nr:hypothetical protein [Methanosarcinales archaeon]